jgi:hypothetical protein
MTNGALRSRISKNKPSSTRGCAHKRHNPKSKKSQLPAVGGGPYIRTSDAMILHCISAPITPPSSKRLHRTFGRIPPTPFQGLPPASLQTVVCFALERHVSVDIRTLSMIGLAKLGPLHGGSHITTRCLQGGGYTCPSHMLKWHCNVILLRGSRCSNDWFAALAGRVPREFPGPRLRAGSG